MKQEHNISSWFSKNPIYTIIIGSVFLRLLVAVMYQHITIYPDSDDYINLAQRLLMLDLNGYEGQRSPGYPLLLSLANNFLLISIILQFAIGTASSIYLYKICLIIGLKKNALVLTLLTICYIPTIFFEFAILSESLTLFCITMIVYILFKIIKEHHSPFRSYCVFSLLCGFLVLIKPFYIYLTGILTMILVVHYIFTKTKFTKILLMLIFPALLFIGWSTINKVNTGYFVSTTYYGFNLAQNCVSFAENTSNEYKTIGNIYAKYRDNRDSSKYEVAMTIWEAYPELSEKTGFSFPDLSDKLYHYSIITIKMNPMAYLKQVGISWIDFWKTSLYWEYDSFTIPYSNIILKYICYTERIILQLIKILFVLLIPFHVILFIRSKKQSPQFIISIIVLATSILQALITYGTNSRFSFPFETLIILSIALDYFNLKRYIKQKS